MDAETDATSSHMIPDTETASFLPPSMLYKRVNWDVFLSFRGEDTRHIFTTPLRDALKTKGLRPFMDDEGMERGDTIQPSLDEAIVDSALAVAIISPRYADSRWCLDELARIFECRKRVIPVFYKVHPSDVRKQRGVFGKGFQEMLGDSNRFSEAQVKKWRWAMENIGNISGYIYDQTDSTDESFTSDEAKEVIRRIVTQVWNELKNTPEYVVKLAVGLDSRVDKVVGKLNLQAQGARFLGIHGTPGIGKTTLAKAVYNKLVVKFKNRCFISNAREKIATEEGFLTVQEELLKDLSLGEVQLVVKQVDEGKKAIKRLVEETRVLVVIDDVFEAGQLEKLGIVREWFKEGSMIIVTSRNVDALLNSACNDELYEAQKLDESEALELFSIHALGRREPTNEFRDVSKKIVSLTGGLPLALEVFGSSLVKKTIKVWEDAICKFGVTRPPSIQEVLKFSYDSLDRQEKIVFLDISCLLLQMNMDREDVVDILAGCDLGADLAIDNLVTKSLMKIIKGKLWMHDQIRDMGRQIVTEKVDDPEKLRRLWDAKDIMRVFRNKKAREDVRGMILDIKKPQDFTDEMIYWYHFRRHPSMTTFIRYLAKMFKGLLTSWHKTEKDDNSILHARYFENMVQLKLLQMNYAKLQGGFRCMPSELRWLQWKGCPQKIRPFNIPEELRVLDLSRSNIDRLWSSDYSCWGFNKVVGNLVVVDLSDCPRLTALPDMSGHKHLKKLTLKYCVGLTKIHPSIGNMSSLVRLNLRGCSNLLDFPRDVTGMKSLKELILSDCSKFRELPQDVRSMTSLNQLFLDRTAITKLPEYLFSLTQLEMLSLNGCPLLTSLPECIGSLLSLKQLILSATALENIPSSVGSLTHLEKLNLMHCHKLIALPDSIGNLKSLTELYLNTSSIKQLPASIGSLKSLRVLLLGRCRYLLNMPVSVGGLASIIELELDNTDIKILPDEICSLKLLEKLRMTDCTLLEKLPDLVGKISNLIILSVQGAAITQLPKSIVELENLTWLNLNKCRKLSSLPNDIGRLKSLCILMMEDTAVTCLPESFGSLDELRTLKLKKSSNDLPKLSALPNSFCKLSNLVEFSARSCGVSGQIRDDFVELSKMETLDLGYNSFHKLPSTLEGLSALTKLKLRHCEKLRFLPQLPSTLVELDAADCYSLESIYNLSKLERLEELELANCNQIKDVPGLECLKSLRRLFMGGCNASPSTVRRRLSKVALRNLNNLSIPGSEIPGWFSQKAVNFTAHPNLAIKSVLVSVVVSVDIQVLDDMRAQLPSIIDIQASIVRLDERIFYTTLILMGIPCTREEQFYLCRFKEYHPLSSLLRDGDTIQVGLRNGTIPGIELLKWGIHLVFENDDDYNGDEDSLQLTESQQSVSQRLVRFFQSQD